MEVLCYCCGEFAPKLSSVLCGVDGDGEELWWCYCTEEDGA